MRTLIKNKLGDEKVLSVYWFVILFIVAAAIVYMAGSFYGNPYDARKIEADLLTNKVADCISEAGYLKEEVLADEFKAGFPENCDITLNVEDSYSWKEQDQYYIGLTLKDFSSKEEILKAEAGDAGLKGYCGLKGKLLPFCFERSLYIIDKENKQYQADIFSILKKTEKNAQ